MGGREKRGERESKEEREEGRRKRRGRREERVGGRREGEGYMLVQLLLK